MIVVGAELHAGLLGRAEERERATLREDRTEVEREVALTLGDGQGVAGVTVGSSDSAGAGAPELHAVRRRALTPAMAIPVQAARARARGRGLREYAHVAPWD